MNFYQFYDRLNGKPYSNMPAPVKYDFLSYADAVSSNPLGNVEERSAELKLMNQDDMARYGADDVVKHYSLIHKDNPNRLGAPLTDSEFKKYLGQTW